MAETADTRYAITGSVAAKEWTSIAPAKSVLVCVDHLSAAAEKWELRPTDANPSVILVEPKTARDIAFSNTGITADGVRRAAPAQVAVDMLNGPGRNPSEGKALLDWMSANEAIWRLM